MTNTEILNQATGIQTAPVKPKPTTFKAIIASKLEDKGAKAMMSLMPTHVNKDALIRTALMLAGKAEFADCEPMTFLTSYATAAQMGLQPNTPLGHCYLIPFKRKIKVNGIFKEIKEVQLMLGYKGMIDVARRSNQIDSINAFVVYKDDEFSINLGTEQTITHIPNLQSSRNEADIIIVYAVAKLKGGGTQFEYLTQADIAKARLNSQTSMSAKEAWQQAKSPWHAHFVEMCRKTAIRKLFKYLPVSLEMATILQKDEKADALEQGVEWLDDENTIDVETTTLEEATN